MNRLFSQHLTRISQRYVLFTRKAHVHSHQWLTVISRVGSRFTYAVGLTMVASPVVYCWSFGKQKEVVAAETSFGDAKVIEEADELYALGNGQKLYDLLVQHKNSQNDDVLWRLARATCDLAKAASDQKIRAERMTEAFEYAAKALAANPNNFACQKWYGILLNYTSELKGTKETIVNSFTVKDHFLKAVELNPKDATSIYLLGIWCFSFADLAWYQRKLAAAIFASPPKTSYEEALNYFLKAEEADPNFYSMNLLMIGKTYVRMGQKDKAVPYLRRAQNYPIKTPDDKQANSEAVELLKSIGVS